MANYAVVQIGGKQYKIQPGRELLVDRMNGDKELLLDKVLLLVEDGEIKIGTPIVSGAQLVVKVVDQEKGKKIDVVKFKAKSRYRKHIGFRPSFTRIVVEKIGASNSSKTKTEPKKKSKTASKKINL